jgi:hypothetical protein
LTIRRPGNKNVDPSSCCVFYWILGLKADSAAAPIIVERLYRLVHIEVGAMRRY